MAIYGTSTDEALRLPALGWRGTSLMPGDTESFQEFGGQYSAGAAESITAAIYAVTPNPDYAGTTYVWP